MKVFARPLWIGIFGLTACGIIALGARWIGVPGVRPPVAKVDHEVGRTPIRQTEGSRLAPEVGSLAPEFVLSADDGWEYRLSRLRGRKVLLSFLCGCSRCAAFAPHWERFHRASSGIVVLGISTFRPSYLAEFRRATRVTFPILFDPGFTVAERYRSTECPRSWVIDEEGIVAFASRRDAGPSATVAALKQHLTLRRTSKGLSVQT